jgi:hypothetical protein
MKITEKLTAEERLALRKVREEQLIANIDKAIGMAPKLSHPPVYKDEDLTIDFRQVVNLLALRQRHRLQAERNYERQLYLASKRNLG